jgi:hypothetical protein
MAGFRFNDLIAEAGFDPREVRLLRHETQKYGKTPYALWRDDPVRFDDYQRIQKQARRAWFEAPYWASFVVAPGGRTLFVGLFCVAPAGPVPSDWIDPISMRTVATLAEYELFTLQRLGALSDYIGRLVIDWGVGTRSWVQLAARQDKPVVELRERFIEPEFPGFAEFVAQLSEIESLPSAWRAVLSAARGVYLLTCPRTREQYVGSATGGDGLIGRWASYVADGHGGNVGLKSRDPSDYRVSILQVAGSADDRDAVLVMEAPWKAKLQSREMGLNRN